MYRSCSISLAISDVLHCAFLWFVLSEMSFLSQGSSTAHSLVQTLGMCTKSQVMVSDLLSALTNNPPMLFSFLSSSGSIATAFKISFLDCSSQLTASLYKCFVRLYSSVHTIFECQFAFYHFINISRSFPYHFLCTFNHPEGRILDDTLNRCLSLSIMS